MGVRYWSVGKMAAPLSSAAGGGPEPSGGGGGGRSQNHSEEIEPEESLSPVGRGGRLFLRFYFLSAEIV